MKKNKKRKPNLETKQIFFISSFPENFIVDTNNYLETYEYEETKTLFVIFLFSGGFISPPHGWNFITLKEIKKKGKVDGESRKKILIKGFKCRKTLESDKKRLWIDTWEIMGKSEI